MSRRAFALLLVAGCLGASISARAGSHSGLGGRAGLHHNHSGHHAHGPGPLLPGPIGPRTILYNPPIGYAWGPLGYYPFAPPLVVLGPGGYFPAPAPPFLMAIPSGPLPEQMPGAQGRGGRVVTPARMRRVDPARAEELVTIGDRLFRAKNLTRAAERYDQAVRANPNSATPRIRLAQIALVRENYGEAVERLREAETAEPGWLLTAKDVQGLYAEPRDFASMIAKLESHLQSKPGDREAWLILGAELFLSGRTRQAADVFLRLDDRAPDAVLAAFLAASRAK